MKKIFTLGAMLAAIFTLTNCTEEIFTPAQQGNSPYTIQANSVETKTANEGFSTVWAENDALSVFHAAAGTAEYSGNSKFVLADAANGLFKTDALDGKPAASNDWYVFYPYNSYLKTPASTSEGYMPVGAQTDGKQTQTGNSSMAHIAGENYPMWGVAKNVSGETLPSVSMTHLASLVEVEVTNASAADFVVSTVSLTAAEDIIGTYYIDFTKESPVFTASGDQYVSKTAVLEVVNGEPVPANGTATFYLAVKPFTAAAGSDLTLSVNGTDKVLNLTKDAVFAPGRIKTLKYKVEGAASDGDLAVTAGEVTTYEQDIEVPLTATGASEIYYAFLNRAERQRYGTPEAQTKYLLDKKGKEVVGDNVVAKASEARTAVTANTTYLLIAIAIDAAGNNSELLALECKTAEAAVINFNSLKVNLGIEKNAPNNVIATISAEGAESYLYWVGKSDDNTWTSSSYLGGTAAKAEKFMATKPNDAILVDLMAKYPVVDGKITMTDLEMDVEHVIVAMAKDKDGLYSHAVMMRFIPLSVDMGNIVVSSDPRWEEAKPTVEWIPERFVPQQGLLPGAYAFNIKLPIDYTVYVLTATDYYFGDDKESYYNTPIPEKINVIIEWTDRPRDFCLDLENGLDYPYSDEHFHCEHGSPIHGNAVLWASQEYHDKVCGCEQGVVMNDYWGSPYERKHIIHINDGNPVQFSQPQAIASTTEVIDVVYVVCQDLNGNCYEPYRFEVPVELFANASPQ